MKIERRQFAGNPRETFINFDIHMNERRRVNENDASKLHKFQFPFLLYSPLIHFIE